MFELLLSRFDENYLAQRLRVQIDLVARLFGDGVGGLHLENIDAIFPVLEFGLRASGLWRRGVENIFDHVVVTGEIPIVGLPPCFDGLRVLHLSDLHLDAAERYLGGRELGRHIATRISSLDFDLAVVTGDHRFDISGPYDRVEAQLAQLVPALDCEFGAWAILGNHDFIEQLPGMERLGLRTLVNEAARLERGDDAIYLVGVDDAHFYGTHDFERALATVPPDSCKIALVHSPEVGELAAHHGIALYLAGHTHGGQLCLPGGLAPYVNARCPRARIRGHWQVGRMRGYTSAGTGSSGLPVRFNQRPEIAIHTLRSAPRSRSTTGRGTSSC